MDIDLLSKMVKELILDNDKVVLPGLGCFTAEIVPASFSDKGYTINPPYRRLSFRSKPNEGHLLARLYARSNNVELQFAERIIKEFVAELKSVLFARKTVVFPGLGRLRATRENNVFFVADENLDIYPSGFALEPVSLKNHQESREEVAAAMQNLASILEPSKQPAPEVDPTQVAEVDSTPAPEVDPTQVAEVDSIPAPEVDAVPAPEVDIIPEPEVDIIPEPEVDIIPEPEEDTTVPAAEDAAAAVLQSPSDKRPSTLRKNFRKAVRISLYTLACLAVLLGLYVIIAHIAPDFIDQILYSAEELEVLHYKF